MLTRLHISILISLVVVVWGASLLILGIPIGWQHIAPFTATVTIVTGACVAFDRWLWKLKPFKGWLVKQPVLNGSWKVTLRSNWVNPETGKTIDPIKCVMVIRQRFSALNARLYTRESSSTLLAHEFCHDDDGVSELVGTYRNTPRADLRGERSEIHHGCFLLQVKGDYLDGHYWTDRGTKGTLVLSDRVDTLFGGYSDAIKQFQLPKLTQ